MTANSEAAEVLIYDEIGAYGVSAKSFLDELGAIPDASAITLRINSPGGSVFDAVAIYNALKRRSGTVTVSIDGIAASAASYVAMAGGEVVMPENAFLMIHDPSGMVMGSAADMRAMAEALDKIRDSLVTGYSAKSGAAIEAVAALMAKETWLSASEALALGFCDRLAEPVRIAAHFDLARFGNAPAEAVTMLAGADDPAAGEDGEADPTVDVDPPLAAEPDPADEAADDASQTAQPAVDVVAVRSDALAYASAVIDLCRLAGLPDMAAQFLRDEASLDQVRAALLERKAEAATELSVHHAQPGKPVQSKPWSQVIARTFRL
ncbi:MAG: Clp protease ClpP [Methylobacterium mesophilicum]|nr:Clp protease ClpP [Methylobacterium mesophilicum]